MVGKGNLGVKDTSLGVGVGRCLHGGNIAERKPRLCCARCREVGRRKRVAGRNSATCTEKGEQTRNHLEVVMRSDPTFELTQGLWNVGQGLQFDELQGPCVP